MFCVLITKTPEHNFYNIKIRWQKENSQKIFITKKWCTFSTGILECVVAMSYKTSTKRSLSLTITFVIVPK